MRRTAYLVANMLGTFPRIMSVSIYSEPPWLMTRMRGDGVMAVLLEVTADSYQEARDDLAAAYPAYLPDLAARFPVAS